MQSAALTSRTPALQGAAHPHHHTHHHGTRVRQSPCVRSRAMAPASNSRGRVTAQASSNNNAADGGGAYVGGKGQYVGWAGGEVGVRQFLDAQPRGAGKAVPTANADDGDVGVNGADNGDASPSYSSSSSSFSSSASGGGNGGVDTVKYSLLKALSTLDRGVSAGDADRAQVRELVQTLETLAKATAMSNALTTPSNRATRVPPRVSLAPVDGALETALNGQWRLAFSSTFAGEQPGSQGFTGAPGGGGGGNPNLGSVYQRIDSSLLTCDNVVELSGGGLPFPFPASSAASASLGHTYTVGAVQLWNPVDP
jgi:hypothetical protein